MIRRSKFGNRKTNGYDSKREAKRAEDLKLMEKLGLIKDLRFQVKFPLIPKQIGEQACGYVADFVYTENGQMIVEDAKGFRTPVYAVKRKLMLKEHGIRIREV